MDIHTTKQTPCATIKAENELLRLRLERSEESRTQLIQRIVRLTKQLDAAEHRIIELLGNDGDMVR